MQDDWGKFFYNTLGLVSLTAENLQRTLAQFAEDRRISLEEGKKLYDDFVHTTEEKRKEFEAQLQKIVQRIANNLNFAQATELQALHDRIVALEARVTDLEQQAQDKPSEG